MTTTADATWTAPVDVRHTEVDGVPALVADLAVDPTLTLMFGVGYSDATPATAGITHLVEHLVMRRVGYVPVPTNAESGLRYTSFYAVGDPAERAGFVRRVCEAITWVTGSITDADLDVERQTILAEIGPLGIYAAGDAHSTRYGVAGIGLTAVTHARLLDWTAAEVRDAAAQWFHRGNAYLVSTGPLPEGLTLPLPAGAPVVRRPHPEPLVTGRAWSEAAGPQVVLSGVCSTTVDDARRTLASAVLRDALHESLRLVSGRVYSVDPAVTQVSDLDEVWTLTLDPSEEWVCDVLVAALDVVDRLAVHGPTAEELERTRSSLHHGLQLSSTRAGWLETSAAYALRGITLPTVEEELRVISEATAQDVRAVIAEVAASLLVTVPAGHGLHDEAEARLRDYAAVGVVPDAEGSTGTDRHRADAVEPDRGGVARTRIRIHRTYRGKLFGPARRHRVTAGPDRLVLAWPGGRHVVPFAEIVLVGEDRDGELEIVTSRGGVVVITPDHFRGLAEPLSVVLDRLPWAVRYRKDGGQSRASARVVS